MQQRGKRGQSATAPVARNMSSRQSGSNTSTYVRTERIATVPGSVSFATVATVPCNPGLSTSFPWLSGHGRLYENYIIRKLVYRYKNFKGTSAPGNIVLSFDPDPLDAAPDSGIAAMQSFRACDGAPWRIFQMSVPTSKKELFTRKTTIAGSDLKTYDAGTLFVSAEGCADASDHGYIEVDYHIDLIRPQAADSVAGASTPVAGLSSSVHSITNTYGTYLIEKLRDENGNESYIPVDQKIRPVQIGLDSLVTGSQDEFLFNMTGGVLAAKEAGKFLLNLQGAWSSVNYYITDPDPIPGTQISTGQQTLSQNAGSRFSFTIKILVNGQETSVSSQTPYPANLGRQGTSVVEYQSLWTSSLIPATGVVDLNPGDVLSVELFLSSGTEGSNQTLVWDSDGSCQMALKNNPSYKIGIAESSFTITMIQVK